MRVVHTHPATWRGRTNIGPALDLHSRAVAAVRDVTDNIEGLWARLRATSEAVYTRIQKARSATQQPSALARVFEEILALHKAGVSAERLRIYVVEVAQLIATLDDPGSASAQRLLEAVQRANVATGAEQLAESTLALRADRLLTAGDIQRHRETTRNAIAALQVQLHELDGYERSLRGRPAMQVIRGGRA